MPRVIAPEARADPVRHTDTEREGVSAPSDFTVLSGEAGGKARLATQLGGKAAEHVGLSADRLGGLAGRLDRGRVGGGRVHAEARDGGPIAEKPEAGRRVGVQGVLGVADCAGDRGGVRGGADVIVNGTERLSYESWLCMIVSNMFAEP